SRPPLEGNLCHDALHARCVVTGFGLSRQSPGGRAVDDPLQPEQNIRCFSNNRRLPSSESSSDSAIAEPWPVSSGCLTIARWAAIWTANSAICRLACARCAKRNQTCAWPSRVTRLPSERWTQFPRTVAHSADILLPCSSRISPPLHVRALSFQRSGN